MLVDRDEQLSRPSEGCLLTASLFIGADLCAASKAKMPGCFSVYFFSIYWRKRYLLRFYRYYVCGVPGLLTANDDNLCYFV